MRRRALLTLVCLTSINAYAITWSELWLTPDQQAQRSLQSGDAATAARLFTDPRRRAYAELAAGRYADAAAHLAPFDDAESQYNRGNALARAGALPDALAAYDAALEHAPINSAVSRDAKHNRDLVAHQLQMRNQQAPQQNHTPRTGGTGRPAQSNPPSAQAHPQNEQSKSEHAVTKNEPQSGNQPSRQPIGPRLVPGNEADKNSAASSQQDTRSAAIQKQQSAAQALNAQNNAAAQSNAEQSPRLTAAPDRLQRGTAANDAVGVKPGDQPAAPVTVDALDQSKKGASASPAQPPPEQALELEQWLRQIADEPGELLRRKFRDRAHHETARVATIKVGFGYIAFLLLLTSLSANAAVRAWLDNNQAVPGDTVRLTLERDGQTTGQPDLAPLKQDFDVLSTSRSNNVQIINGSMSSHTQLRLMLSPKHSGQLTVPSITWDADRTTPLNLNVSAAAGGSNKSNGGPIGAGAVYLETTVDQPQPYVQAAVNVTVRLYAAEPLGQASLDLPASSDVLVQQVGSDRTRTTEKNGRRYQVVERHYLLFPQHSGKLRLPGAVLDAQILTPDRSGSSADDVFGNVFGKMPFGAMLTTSKPIRLHGEPIVLSVRPRPVNVGSSYWLPARSVSVNGEWHPDSLQAYTGDPVTVNLHLQAEGLTAAQLPDAASLLDLPAGLKAYPDQAKLKNTAQEDTIVGSRDQSIALIADQPGQFTLPAVHVHWWDTKTDQARETSLSACMLTILPAAGAANTRPTAVMPSAPTAATEAIARANSQLSPDSTKQTRSAGNNTLWHWLSFTLSLLWIATLFAWYASRRSKPSIQAKTPAPQTKRTVRNDAARARAELHEACRQNNAQLARRALLAWAASVWPDAPPAGVHALAKRIDDANVAALLVDLDRACYAGGDWRGAALAEALSDLPAPQRPTRDPGTELAPLYY